MIERAQITGCVLAGGQGSRMGGLDKGLQPFRGLPLAQHALQRLAPQVGALMLNANRNPERYAAFGVPVWPDAIEGFAGPLAGFAAGLAHCATPWLLTVPCDTPLFPADLAVRLAAAADAAGAALAYACTREDGRVLPQPAFCLMHASLLASLERYLAEGGRKITPWARAEGAAAAVFDRPGDDPTAFANANTPAELAALQAPPDTELPR
ncbi:MAG: molybdenum cofactor guanylyltransferase MobA [Proteobacteria bacterium]|nr:molybdenum cofactor guanylyltransferase MobA [Pseudomonadota bacterium]